MEYVHEEDGIPTYLFVQREYANPQIDVYPVIVSTISSFAINKDSSHSFSYRVTDSYFTYEVFTGLCEAWLENQHEDLD